MGHLRRGTMGLVWLLCGIALQAAGDGSVTGTVTDQERRAAAGRRRAGGGVRGGTRPGVDDDRRRRRLSHRAPAGRRVLDRVRALRLRADASADRGRRRRHAGGQRHARRRRPERSRPGVVTRRPPRRRFARRCRPASRTRCSPTCRSPSRNYTHVIVAEAGVSAPLPDRTGRSLNLATEPGAQAEDALAVAEPERQRRAADQQRAAGQRHRRDQHAERVAAASAAASACRSRRSRRSKCRRRCPRRRSGRNGGGNIDIVTRPGHQPLQRDRRGYYVPARDDERQRVLPQPRRHRQARVPPQRHQRRRSAARSVRAARSSSAPAQQHAVPVRLRQQRHRRDRPAGRADDVRTRRDDRRASPTTSCATAPPTTRPSPPNFLRALRAFPADQQAGLIATFFSRRQHADLPRADAGRHPSGRAQHPEHDARRPLPDPVDHQRPCRCCAATAPSAASCCSSRSSRPSRTAGPASSRCSIAPAPATRHAVTFVRSTQRVEEAFGWADASPSPTDRQHAGAARRRHQHAHLRLEAAAGSQRRLLRPARTRASRSNRDIFNSTLGIHNPLEDVDRRPGRADADHRHQHAAQLRRHRQRLGLLRPPARAARVGRAGRSSPASTRCSRASSTGRVRLDRRVHVAHQRRPGLRQLGVLLHRTRRLGRRIGPRSGRHAARLPHPGRRRVRAGRLEDRRRPDRQRRPALRRVRDASPSATAASATTTCPRPRRRSAPRPGFNVPGNAPFFQPGFDPLQIGLYVVPGTPVDISQIHVAPNDSTLRGD